MRSNNVTTTATKDWQETCRGWADEGKYFELDGVKFKHLAFCKELCDEFGYECVYDSQDKYKTAHFSPAF